MAPKTGKAGSEKGELASVDPEPNDVTSDKEESKSTTEAAKGSEPEEVDPKEDTKQPKETSDSKKESAPSSLNTGKEDAEAPPPQRPARPERKKSAFTTNYEELQGAFPDASKDVCRGMLVAAANNLESAFSGMLAISDDTIRPAAYIKEQIAHDEQLARRLAMSEQHRRRRDARESRESRESHRLPRRREYDYTEDTPLNDTTDELYDGFQRGITGTKQAVSTFWGSLKQKINGEVYDEDDEEIYARSSASSGSREPLRSQWFPRQPSGPQTESASAPRLPPRKPSRPSTASETSNAAAGATATVNSTATTTTPTPVTTTSSGAKPEPRSVNAFGDETAKGSDRPDEQEPDAFFIGESDDDLGSLDDEDVSLARSESKKEHADSKSETKKELEKDDKKSSTSGGSETKSKEDTKSEDKKGDVKGEEKKEDAKSAKDLLSKFKSESEKSK